MEKMSQQQDLQEQKMQVILLYIILLLAINKISNGLLIQFKTNMQQNMNSHTRTSIDYNFPIAFSIIPAITLGKWAWLEDDSNLLYCTKTSMTIELSNNYNDLHQLALHYIAIGY